MAVQHVDHLKPILAIVHLTSYQELQTLNLIIGADEGDGPVEFNSEVVIFRLVGDKFIPSKLLNLCRFHTVVDVTNPAHAVTDFVVDLHALDDEPSQLVKQKEGEMISCPLLLLGNIASL